MDMRPRHAVAAILHPDYVGGPFSPTCLPFTQTTCRNVCTTSTRSRCSSITASMDLYAIGSRCCLGMIVQREAALRLRDMEGPIPWLQTHEASGLPLPRTM